MDRVQHRFLVDRMLGRLIAWLRIFGYDTKSASGKEAEPGEDSTLIRIALAENRVLVSRDRALVERAKKAGARAILLSDDDVARQFETLDKYYSIKADPEMSRCTACNSTIRKATSDDIERLRSSPDIPGHLIDEGVELWVCDSCGKIYWQGSHWRNILRTAAEVKEKLEKNAN